MTLYAHQSKGVSWLAERESAGLFWEMGVGKSRTALLAAKRLFDLPSHAKRRIDRVLVLAPASVCYAWREELSKLSDEGFDHNLLRYDPKAGQMLIEQVGGNLSGGPQQHMPIAVVSYSLLSQGERSKRTDRHVRALEDWCGSARTVLICDESSFLKSRTAKQTRGAHAIALSCRYRWLLSGTPVCNSPLDLYAQAKVMAPNGAGPLRGVENYYHFQAMFGEMVAVVGRNAKPLMVVGRDKNGRVRRQAMKRWVADESRLVDLQERFAPYVSRVEKRDCLDLPEKSYTVREVALRPETWAIYQELKRDAMLALGGGSEARPEPNAAVRILRLCQLTSGHVGSNETPNNQTGNNGGEVESARTVDFASRDISSEKLDFASRDISSEKLDFLADAIVNGELANERALIVWCRWRRERERLISELSKYPEIGHFEIFGGQSEKYREEQIKAFCIQDSHRRVLAAQPHAGGFGLNLTAASTAVYLSNDFSYSTRVQSEDRCHRIGQRNPVTYWDVVAVGPKGQKTVDHAVLEALRAKKNIAEWTVSAWREALED